MPLDFVPVQYFGIRRIFNVPTVLRRRCVPLEIARRAYLVPSMPLDSVRRITDTPVSAFGDQGCMYPQVFYVDQRRNASNDVDVTGMESSARRRWFFRVEKWKETSRERVCLVEKIPFVSRPS